MLFVDFHLKIIAGSVLPVRYGEEKAIRGGGDEDGAGRHVGGNYRCEVIITISARLRGQRRCISALVDRI